MARPAPTRRRRAYCARWPFVLQPPDAALWELTDEFACRTAHVVDAATFGRRTPQLAGRLRADVRLVRAGISTDR
ncbi:hypothetical protein [Streptomyces sp. DSM 118148]|uniref:hypothetical protein n=1 Tax=Streptomyces sp. DSM 118148 TaxID=3448667 RepID=UPI00403FDA19